MRLNFQEQRAEENQKKRKFLYNPMKALDDLLELYSLSLVATEDLIDGLRRAMKLTI